MPVFGCGPLLDQSRYGTLTLNLMDNNGIGEVLLVQKYDSNQSKSALIHVESDALHLSWVVKRLLFGLSGLLSLYV